MNQPHLVPDNTEHTTTTQPPLYSEGGAGSLSLFYPLLLLVAALLVPTVWGEAMVCGIGCGLLALKRRAALRKLIWALPLALLGTLPLLLVKSEGGVWGWSITNESLRLFSLIVLRCVAAFAAVFLLLETAPIYLLMHHLRRWRVPSLIVELAEMIYRYIYILWETAQHILTAQRSRLGYATLGARPRHAAMLFAQTFVLSYKDADEVYNGLLSRGYGDNEVEEAPVVAPSCGTAPLIQLSGVHFAYEPAHPVLRGIHLSISSGERIAVLGENGAGKSTLFCLLNGILTPQQGSYYIEGTLSRGTAADRRTLRRRVAILFQNSNHQLFTPSVADEIAFGLKNIGLKGTDLQQRVDEVLRRYDLVPLMHTPPHLLSEGQKKWVAIAAIMAMNPDIVVMDEPTAGLDMHYSAKVRELLDTLHNQGRTILLSTHDMDFAYQWADRGIVLHHGEVIADADIASIYTNLSLLATANLTPPRLADYRALSRPSSQVDDALPLFFPSQAHHALIVGGGKGAYRKALTFAENHLAFTVIAPEVCPDMAALIAQQQATYHPHRYVDGEAWGYTLVVAATGDPDTDKLIAQECRMRSIPVNILSAPDESTFQLGAVGQRQGMKYAVQTAHRLPEVSQAVRDAIDHLVDRALDGAQLVALSTLRQEMLQAQHSGDTVLYNASKEAYQAAKQRLLHDLQ